ncbi:hypothetical protein LCGC14_2091570 [marine sediment metagenome]|uniref:Uncharacterized protein n=1 Tax=marine sediment metagenome TaxID=412755 RepID=A0A0F9ECI9_9ZZZZ|nr:hypothetical protein [bacterium]
MGKFKNVVTDRKYHTLLVKYEKGDKWEIAFGDFDKKVVQQEELDSYMDVYQALIITTSEEQVEIDSKVKRFNDAEDLMMAVDRFEMQNQEKIDELWQEEGQ